MIEKYGLFDSVEGDEREYAEVDLARLGRALSPHGVRGDETALRVTASPIGLGVNIAPGLAVIDGRYYELVDDGSGVFALNLTATSDYPRIDRIVLELNYSERTVKLKVMEGEKSASPQAPEIVRDTDQYMLSLAQVYVAVGAGSLSQEDVTDERADADLCGLMPVTYTPPVVSVNGQGGAVTLNAQNVGALSASGSGAIVQTDRVELSVAADGWTQNAHGWYEKTVACAGTVADSQTQRVDAAVQGAQIGNVLLAGMRVEADDTLTMVCLAQPAEAFTLLALISEVV